MEYFNNCLRCLSYNKNRAANDEDRCVYANRPEINKSFHFTNNSITTSKYNLITFLPINLFEQLTRAANLYFLLQIIIMSIPQITAMDPFSTIIPLMLIMLLTMIKDGYEDIGRHRSDNRLNNQTTCVRNVKGEEKRKKWQEIKTGDMIKVLCDEPVPADILVLSTNDESGLCFIETADLDGETNLKVRQPLVDTEVYFQEEARYEKFDGKVTCEPPNNRLDKFLGNLEWKNEVYSLDNSNIILRGCVLRNTPFVYGLVLYAGHDSKLMMNSGKQVFKRSKLDRFTNILVICIAGLLGFICAFLSLMSYFWERDVGQKWLYILPWETYYNDDPGFIALFNWPGFIMALNTLIPISLYLSVEVIRMGQSLLINWDLKMYHQETDTPALARNTTLTEELGQIQYIFSDKTGTLTQNVMLFKECSINGTVYGHVDEDELIPSDGLDCVDFSFNKYADPAFKFVDQTLVDSIRNNEVNAVEFFRLLALCHTVMVEEKEREPDSTDYIPCDGYEKPVWLDYQAQSPDEGALVSAARNFGVVFKKRTPTTIVIEVNGVEESYELLSVLDFDNVRKRMSVIVKYDGKITLYCKGADTIMFDLLTDDKPELKEKTFKDLDTFAQSGLRTLLLAYKELSQEEYEKWNTLFEEASTAMTDREEKVMETFTLIERDLILLGASAIEDKLQDGVPATIAALADANINLWVLTGDKQETAINIGYSSMLLTDDMIDIFIVDGDTEHEVEKQIDEYLEKADAFTINSTNTNTTNVPAVRVACPVEMELKASGGSVSDIGAKGFGLVIPGKSLAFALSEKLEMRFLELAKLCKAVICCRVTPLQKALVVELVKRNVKATTLAIGDGANDVSMIKAAHIGVGISGKEGRQAVLAADYSFAQFRFLQRLLLVHGRWSYLRMSKFLNYFFYKNFAFTLVQFWFMLFCGFSAQSLYDESFVGVYNVVFTSLPVLVMGIFDQDVNDERCLEFPKLYLPGQQNILFNRKKVILKLLHGTVTSFVMFFVPYGIYQDVFSSDGTVHSDLSFFGIAVGAILVIVVNLQVALDTLHWTWINHLFIWGSIAFYFAYTFFIYSELLYNGLPSQFSNVGDAAETFSYTNFWAALFLTVTVCIPTNMASRWIRQKLSPSLADKIRRGLMRKPPLFSLSARRRKSRALSRKRPQSTRSAYAFSQEKGFGALLLKGRWMNRLKIKSKSSSYDLNRLTQQDRTSKNNVLSPYERSRPNQNLSKDTSLHDADVNLSNADTNSNSKITVL